MIPFIGKNMAHIANVAMNIGMNSSFALAAAASTWDIPFPR